MPRHAYAQDCALKQQVFRTEILVASVRSPEHMRASALIGADVATLPPDVLKSLINHPLTDKGLDAFLADWQKSGQSIA